MTKYEPNCRIIIEKQGIDVSWLSSEHDMFEILYSGRDITKLYVYISFNNRENRRKKKDHSETRRAPLYKRKNHAPEIDS